MLGSVATGLYGAAAKFIELVELPIRSQGAVLSNELARLFKNDHHRDAFNLAKREIFLTTLRITPIAFGLGIIVPFLIKQISGDAYNSSVPILRIMAIYCFLIPADRSCGLLLEAFGRPDLKLLKVIVVLVLNIAGDVVAIYLFQSPLAVAWSSLIVFSIGIAFGLGVILLKIFPKANSAKLKLTIGQQ